MKVDKFLTECIEEPSFITVERSSSSELSEEQLTFYNKTLQGHGYFVDCYKCNTCSEHTEGKEPYHIERRELYLKGVPNVLCTTAFTA